jgi:Mannosyltransferase (PIG-V)
MPRRPLPWREATTYCLKVFLVMRVGLTVLALAGVALMPINQKTQVSGWPAPETKPGWTNAVTAFERWDALWFLRIAEDGYTKDDGSAAFFPAYPMAVRGVSTVLGGHPLPAALLVSNVAFLGALILLYLLSRLEFNEATARRTVVYASIFPTAFFFIAPYSESLFLLAAVGSILCARLDKWPAAGILGAVAALTRSIGIVLLPVLAVEAFMQRRRGESAGASLWRAGWALSAGVGTLVYLGYWKAESGSWLTPVSKQSNWLRELAAPIGTLIDGTEVAFRFIGSGLAGYQLLDWLIVAPVLVATGWAVIRLRPTYAVYAVLSMAIPLTLIYADRPFMSLPRFAVVVWPIYWAMSKAADRWNIHTAMTAVSASLLGLFTVLFVNWYWIF